MASTGSEAHREPDTDRSNLHYYAGNESVISFMAVHAGKSVFLNTRIDVSVAID